MGYLKSRRNATGLVLRLWQRLHASTASAAYDTYMELAHASHTSNGSRGSSEGLGFLAEMLDLDVEITRSYWDEVMRWIEQAIPTNVRRIVDLGAGTGAGTFAPVQEISTMPRSSPLTRQMRCWNVFAKKALDCGLTERIRTVQADLDTDWPETGLVDFTWASMFMHHLTYVDGVLQRIHAATRDAGLIVIAEFTDPLRFLPGDLGLGRARPRRPLVSRHSRGSGLDHYPTSGWSGVDAWKEPDSRRSRSAYSNLKEIALTPAVRPDMHACGLNASVRGSGPTPINRRSLRTEGTSRGHWTALA